MAENSGTSVPVIDRVIEMQPARTLAVDGYTFLDKDKTASMFVPPAAKKFPVTTLHGFVQLLENGIEGLVGAGIAIHVEDFDRVSTVALCSDVWGRRACLAEAVAAKPERAFRFNTFIAQEEFNIALQSMFVDTEEVEELLKVSGNLANELEVRQQDDGFTQRVTAKNGVHLVAEVTVKPRVALRPWRTFVEIEQPQGEYIFRVKHDERLGNQCALFEADGGLWRHIAMQSIGTWMRNRIAGSPVAAVNALPVIV